MDTRGSGPVTGGFRIETANLVVQSDASLPTVCVVTGDALSEEDMDRHSIRGSNWGDIRPRECSVVYGMAEGVRSKYRRRKSILLVYRSIAAALLIGLYVNHRTDLFPELKASIYLVIMALAMLNCLTFAIRTSPLRVTKYRNGEYWIGGCGLRFIHRLKNLENTADHPVQINV